MSIGEWFAIFLTAIAMSSTFGFNLVSFLVKVVEFIDKILGLNYYPGVLDPGYIKLWLPFIVLVFLALIPMYGIWYVLKKILDELKKE